MEEKQLPIVDDNGREGTARFMVPKLDVDLTPAQLLAGQGGASVAAMEATAARAAITGNVPAAIEAPAPDATPEPPTAEEFLIRARAAATFTAFKAIWDEAAATNISPTQAQSDEMTAIGKRLQATQQQRQTGAAEGAPAAPAGDPELIWQQIVTASPWPMSELREKFIDASGGVAPEDAGVQDLTAFLNRINSGAVA